MARKSKQNMIMAHKEMQAKNKNYATLSNLAQTRFIWENLPKGLESRYIEHGLYIEGRVAFFKHNGLLKCLPCNQSDQLNDYGEPVGYRPYGVSNVYNNVDDTNSVILYDSDNGYPIYNIVSYYSDLITEIESTYRMNLVQQRMPFIVLTEKNKDLTMKNIMEKLYQGDIEIYADEQLGRDGKIGVSVLKTDSPYLLEKLNVELNNKKMELLEILGYNVNKSQSKKERLVTNEVDVNNMLIQSSIQKQYENRLKACKKVNEMFGTNITVKKIEEKIEVDFIGKIDEKNKKDKETIDK